MPAKSLDEDAPRYDRPLAEPADLAERRARRRRRRPAGSGASTSPPRCVAMLADTSWVSSQYDHQLFLNTVVAPGGDAAVLRLKHPTTGVDTGRGLALTTDGNHRWCAVDPRVGTASLVAEAVLNLACVGARPLALVNNLNFGNPEHPEVMWQLSEAIDGMGEACRALGVPVVGGNVSLYNESRGRDIDPTPVVGVLGVVDRLDRRPPGSRSSTEDRLVVLGAPARGGLAGSRLAGDHGLGRRRHAAAGRPRCRRRTSPPWCASSCSTGSCRAPTTWPRAGSASPSPSWRSRRASASRPPASTTSPSCSASPSVGSCSASPPTRWPRCTAATRRPACRRRMLGPGRGDRLTVKGLLDIAVADAATAWRDRLPTALGHGTVQG